MTETAKTPTRPAIIVDVGARWGAAATWRSLTPPAKVYGFDPDVDECLRLNLQARQEGDSNTQYIPIALGASHGKSPLFVTQEPACSSVYEPMTELIDRFPVLRGIAMQYRAQIEVQSLDDWCTSNDVDYIDVLKIDTQGSELAVLQGAERVLSTAAVIQCEVEFNPIYNLQPLFSDIDRFLRDHGFALWRLENLVHYFSNDEVADLSNGVTVFANNEASRASYGGGQLYWADATWVRAELCAGATTIDSPGIDRLVPIVRAAGLTDLAAELASTPRPDLAGETYAADHVGSTQTSQIASESDESEESSGSPSKLGGRSASRKGSTQV